MDKTYVIGVDCGTQSTRAILFDIKGRIIKQSKVKLDILSPYPGWTEQNSDAWWNSLCSALRAIIDSNNLKYIKGIGIAYQRESFVMIDKKARQIRPAILWNDQRAVQEVEEMRNELGEDNFLKTTGKFLDTVPSSTKINWIRNREPENYKRLDKILDVGSFLNWKLTGNMVSPLAGADTSGILDIVKKKWSEDILTYLNLKSTNMEETKLSGSVVGKVTSEASTHTGLPVGLPVVAGGGDGQVFAIGVRSLGEDDVALTLGTGAAWGVHHKTYRNSSYFRSMIGCIPETFYFESVLISGASIVSWFVNSMAVEEREVSKKLNMPPEHLLEKEIENINPGCDGLITVPYWKGAMMPYNDPSARGITIGWSDYHGGSHFYRSILEGIAYEIRLVIEGYAECLGVDPHRIRIGSGGAESTFWNQIISDVTGKEVILSGTVENTSLGAAMITAWGLKYYKTLQDASLNMSHDGSVFKMNPNNHELYSLMFKSVYKNLYAAVRKYTNELGKMVLNHKLCE